MLLKIRLDPSTPAIHLVSLSLLVLVFSLAAPAQANLIAFYTFDGNANDVTGDGYDGVVSGATLATGYEGQAYDFGGNSDTSHIQVNLDINPSALPTLTMGAWVKTDSLTLSSVISHDNGGYDRSLYLDFRGSGSDYRWSAFTGDGGGVISAGPDPATIGEWAFLAVRYGSGLISLTVDGDTVGTSATQGTGYNYLWVGNNPGHLSEDFDGLIDNVFFYDEWLSDARLAEIRAGGAEAILPSPQDAPEPGTLVLMGLGILGPWLRVRRPREGRGRRGLAIPLRLASTHAA